MVVYCIVRLKQGALFTFTGLLPGATPPIQVFRCSDYSPAQKTLRPPTSASQHAHANPRARRLLPPALVAETHPLPSDAQADLSTSLPDDFNNAFLHQHPPHPDHPHTYHQHHLATTTADANGGGSADMSAAKSMPDVQTQASASRHRNRAVLGRGTLPSETLASRVTREFQAATKTFLTREFQAAEQAQASQAPVHPVRPTPTPPPSRTPSRPRPGTFHSNGHTPGTPGTHHSNSHSLGTPGRYHPNGHSPGRAARTDPDPDGRPDFAVLRTVSQEEAFAKHQFSVAQMWTALAEARTRKAQPVNYT